MAHRLRAAADPRTPPPTPTRIITTTKGAEPLRLEHLNRAALNFGFLALFISISFAQKRLFRDAELSLAGLDLMPDDPAETEIDLEKGNALSAQIGRLPV
jgi:hypothetical protein